MRNGARYRIIASALLVLVMAVAVLLGLAGVQAFAWVAAGQYVEGLARFLAGGFGSLLVVFLLFPLLGQPGYARTSRKLDRMLDPRRTCDEWAIGVIREQERHLRWLAWRLSFRNLLLSFFGGLIAAAVADWFGGRPLTVACLVGLLWGAVVGLVAGLWAWRHPLPPEEPACPLPGIPPLSDLDGSRPEHRERLRRKGIATAGDLLRAAATPEARRQLAQDDRLNLTPALIEQFAIEAELLRSIAGLNEEYAGLLYRTGVKGVADLARRDLDQLDALICARYDEKIEHGEDPPGKEMVENWIAQAQLATPILKY